jgi:hypothetical protein
MRDEFSPVTDPADTDMDTAKPGDRPGLDLVLLAYPWLKSLEPFYIEWELVWPM